MWTLAPDVGDLLFYRSPWSRPETGEMFLVAEELDVREHPGLARTSNWFNLLSCTDCCDYTKSYDDLRRHSAVVARFYDAEG